MVAAAKYASVYHMLHSILFLATLASQLSVLIVLKSHTVLFYSHIFIITLGGIITNLVSLEWIRQGYNFTGRRLSGVICVSMHVALLGPLWRNHRIFMCGQMSYPDSSELPRLRCAQAWGQDGPLIVLHMWYLISQSSTGDTISCQVMGALVLEFISFCSCVTWMNTVKFGLSPGRDPEESHMQCTRLYSIIHVVKTISFFSSRFVAASLFAYSFHTWLFLVIISHSIIFTTGSYFSALLRTTTRPLNIKFFLTRLVQVYDLVPYGPSTWRLGELLMFYSLVTMENCSASLVCMLHTQTATAVGHEKTVVFVLGSLVPCMLVLGTLLLILQMKLDTQLQVTSRTGGTRLIIDVPSPCFFTTGASTKLVKDATQCKVHPGLDGFDNISLSYSFKSIDETVRLPCPGRPSTQLTMLDPCMLFWPSADHQASSSSTGDSGCPSTLINKTTNSFNLQNLTTEGNVDGFFSNEPSTDSHSMLETNEDDLHPDVSPSQMPGGTIKDKPTICHAKLQSDLIPSQELRHCRLLYSNQNFLRCKELQLPAKAIKAQGSWTLFAGVNSCESWAETFSTESSSCTELRLDSSSESSSYSLTSSGCYEWQHVDTWTTMTWPLTNRGATENVLDAPAEHISLEDRIQRWLEDITAEDDEKSSLVNVAKSL